MRSTVGGTLVLALIAAGASGEACCAQAPDPEARLRPHAATLEPLRCASFRRLPDGSFARTGPWRPYIRPGRGPDVPAIPLFDCFEADSMAEPTGFCTSGCDQLGNCPAAPPDSRWDSGPAYLSPVCINDMTVAAGREGAFARRALLAWNWGPASPTQCFVGLLTSESFNGCAAAAPTGTDYDGVLLDFGPQAGGQGYFTSDADLSADPTLFWQMPLDGSGAYTYIFARAEDPVTGALTLENTPGTQHMLWGTGEDEIPADGRAGMQQQFQFDDSAPADGMISTTAECFDLTAGTAQCPLQFGAMVLFFGQEEPPSCYANCDGSTQPPVLNVADFTCFLQAFAAGCP